MNNDTTFSMLPVGAKFTFGRDATRYRKVRRELYVYDTDPKGVWKYYGLPYWKVCAI